MVLGFPRAKQGLCHYDIRGWGDPSLIRYSSKTAEQNFMKLSGIVHYTMPYSTSYFKFIFEWFWGFPEQNIWLCHTKHGYHFVSIAHSISSFCILSSPIDWTWIEAIFLIIRSFLIILFFLNHSFSLNDKYCYFHFHQNSFFAFTNSVLSFLLTARPFFTITMTYKVVVLNRDGTSEDSSLAYITILSKSYCERSLFNDGGGISVLGEIT